MARMVEAYHAAPEQRLARDKAELARLQSSDPSRVPRGPRDVEVLEARIADAEARQARPVPDTERVKRILNDEPVPPPWAAGSTSGSQIPAGDFGGAVADLIIAGVRPGLVESFLEHGRGDHPKESREYE